MCSSDLFCFYFWFCLKTSQKMKFTIYELAIRKFARVDAAAAVEVNVLFTEEFTTFERSTAEQPQWDFHQIRKTQTRTIVIYYNIIIIHLLRPLRTKFSKFSCFTLWSLRSARRIWSNNEEPKDPNNRRVCVCGLM